MSGTCLNLAMLNKMSQFVTTSIIYQIDSLLHPVQQVQGMYALPHVSLLNAAEQANGSGRPMNIPMPVIPTVHPVHHQQQVSGQESDYPS
ncbi:hypothetical protein SARC_16077, partial [Sphaeroforma arctica JP610]